MRITGICLLCFVSFLAGILLAVISLHTGLYHVETSIIIESKHDVEAPPRIISSETIIVERRRIEDPEQLRQMRDRFSEGSDAREMIQRLMDQFEDGSWCEVESDQSQSPQE